MERPVEDEGGAPDTARAWSPGKIARLRRSTFEILELAVPGDRLSYVFDVFMICLIVANVVAIVLETVASLEVRFHGFFSAFDVFSVAVFTVEYVLRVWSCIENRVEGFDHPLWGRLKFVASPLAIIDLLAFLPFYLHAFIGLDLRMLRIFRLLRLLKLTRYSPALIIIGAVVRAQHRALTAALLIMMTALLFSASIVYALEREAQPEAFASIPDAMWWAMATLTTVGYGDVTPITPLGRVFGAVTMVFGVGMFALPTGVIATGFAQEIRKHDFVVNWRLVSRVPLFSRLDAAQIAEIVSLLTPLVVPPNQAMVRLGEEADSMYFIVSGKAEVETLPNPVFLEAGDFFGEIGLIKNRHRVAAVVALTECQLLELKKEDFWRLVDAHPALRDNIEAIADQRLNEIDSGGIEEQI